MTSSGAKRRAWCLAAVSMLLVAASPNSARRGDVSASGFVWPLRGEVSSGFGPRFGGMHTGIDIDADIGTPVAAANEGRVTLAETYFGYGTTVMVAHGNSRSTLYGHLSKTLVRPGDEVERGDIVGLSGCSGDCTGDHLHFEVREGGRPVRPLPYLRPAPPTKTPLDPGYAPITDLG